MSSQPPPPDSKPPSTIRVPSTRSRPAPPPLLVALVAPDHRVYTLHAEWDRLGRAAPREEPSSLAELICEDDLLRVVLTLEMLRDDATVVFDARLRDGDPIKLRFRATLDDANGRIRLVAPALRV